MRLDEKGLAECYWWLPKRVRWDEVDSVYVDMVAPNAYAPIVLLRNGTELELKSLGQLPTRARRPRSRVAQQVGMIRDWLCRNNEPHAS